MAIIATEIPSKEARGRTNVSVSNNSDVGHTEGRSRCISALFRGEESRDGLHAEIQTCLFKPSSHAVCLPIHSHTNIYPIINTYSLIARPTIPIPPSTHLLRTAMASPALPKTMRAIHQPDRASSKLRMAETPVPTPTDPDDVLVKVAATSPCRGELWWARDFPSLFPADKEPVPGQDLAGTVVAAPSGSQFKPGDEVFARIHATRPGAAREYALALQTELALKPKRLGWVDAAAVPLSALTAWQAVFTHGTLEPAAVFGDEDAKARNAKKRVLVTAASGGVGGFAVQFAAAAGAAAVVAVNSGAKAQLVRELGATEVVDYKKQAVDAWASEDPASRVVDLIVDCIGGPTMGHLWAAIKEGGTFISVCNHPDAVKPADTTKSLAKAHFFIVEPLGSQLGEISKLIDAGSFRPLVDSVFEFMQFQEAFDKADGNASGKVVLKVSVSVEESFSA